MPEIKDGLEQARKYGNKIQITDIIQLFNECVDGLGDSSTVSERYHRALAF